MKVKNQYLKILEYLHLSFNKWPSIQFKLWVSLVLWNHKGNTADLAMVQKTIIDTLHKEGKSLLKGMAVQGVLYQTIINAKLTGRKKLGRKMCTSNRDDHKLENTVNQSRFKHLGELHKEWTEAGVSALSHFWIRNIVRSILPGLRRKRTELLLSGPKSSFQMKVHFAFHLEIKVPESGGKVERHRIHVAWSPVWSFHSQWWFEMPCYLLVLVHCVCTSADKLYGDADLIFHKDLPPAHTAKGT